MNRQAKGSFQPTRQESASSSEIFIDEGFRILGGKEKTASKNGTEDKAKTVLEILSNNGQLTGQDIANQCSFESRMASAGVIAQLVRTKAIESVPASYRITEIGRNILAAPPTTAESPGEAAEGAAKEQQEQPKKSKRRSKKEPQNEPSSGQDEQSS